MRPELEGLGDDVWMVLRYLASADHGGTRSLTALQIARTGELPITDDRRVFELLKIAERCGLTERQRNEVSAPWWWRLSNEGRAALVERGAP